MSTPKPAGFEHLDFIEPDELVTQLKDTQAASKTVVVDVREPAEGYATSHIKGAISVPTSNFEENVEAVKEQLAGAEQIVVHCMHSQRRGPSAASKLIDQLASSGSGAKVVVLSGGFHRFASEHAGNEQLLEGSNISEPPVINH